MVFYNGGTITMKTKRRLSAILLAIFLITSAVVGTISASSYYSGQWVGFGSVKSSSSRAVASNLTYANTIVSGSSGGNQQLKTLTFNPKTSNYMPLVYSQFSGYGATTINSAKAAEARGYDVKGAVNASFFSFTGSSCNTYGGVNISDGRILQGNNDHGGNWELTFNSDGSSALVWSKVAYSIVAKGGAWNAPLTFINICPETTYGGIYYYDDLCGTSTDTKAAGVEIVFEKQNGTQLTVGGTLVGKVVAVRSNVSSGGSIGSNRFVLYASNGSAYASYLRGFAVGDKVEITATETVAGAKTVMENCNSAFVTYGYHIVNNGQNVTSSNGLGESFNRARAQRSAIGVKADGTLIIVATNGRTTSYSGLTVYELADFLISQGCVTGINLDGGGSTQLTVENASGGLETAIASSRRVANSILVVARPSISSSLKNNLNAAVKQANELIASFELSGNTAALQSALSYASTVSQSSKSMPGDYTKAAMRVREALSGVTKVGYKTGVYRLNSAFSLLNSSSASAAVVSSLPSGKSLTVTQVSGNFGYTKYLDSFGWIDLTKATRIANASNAKAEISVPELGFANQDIVISWTEGNGASSYSYRVIELVGEPDPGNSNESEGSVLLAEGKITPDLSVTVPAALRTSGRYLKVAVCVDYPGGGSAWSTAYVETSALPFTDVLPTHWGYSAVKHCYDKGYFSGTTPSTFEPNSSMSRSMMAVVIYRMAGKPETDASVSVPFTDISLASWYYPGVAWCYSEGVVLGTTGTTFSPNDNITREQAACFLYRLAGALGHSTEIRDLSALNAFEDADTVGGYAKTAMIWAVENGIMRGNGGRLNPKDTATRVQIASLIANFDAAFAN